MKVTFKGKLHFYANGFAMHSLWKKFSQKKPPLNGAFTTTKSHIAINRRQTGERNVFFILKSIQMQHPCQ